MSKQMHKNKLEAYATFSRGVLRQAAFALVLCMFLSSTVTVHSKETIESTINVKSIGSFKNEKITFYDLKDGEFVKTKEPGLDNFIPSIFHRFIIYKVVEISDSFYTYGVPIIMIEKNGKMTPQALSKGVYAKSALAHRVNMDEVFHFEK